MKNKKIAIITHYYESKNYGGNLQAYALCEYLNKHGYNSEQLGYEYMTKSVVKTLRIKKIFTNGITGFFKYGFDYFIKFIKAIFNYGKKKKYAKLDKKGQAFKHFNSSLIPHSEKVYNKDNISNCVDDYDAFITGSDQVWKLIWYHPAFFLTFVPSDKPKISYGASIAMDSLSESQRALFKENLKDYKAISLREPSSIKMIEDLCPVKPVSVLDPTLLLSSDDWDKVCADRVVEKDYVFCYFLCYNKTSRKIAKQYAKKHNKVLVCIPMHHHDVGFGDVSLYDVGPEKFLSLIKYADKIFTDSFHAVVISNVYSKQYFVFKREKKDDMSVRIFDITSLFNQEERFCHTKERANLSYVESLADIDYSKKNIKFEELKTFSENFLLNALGD